MGIRIILCWITNTFFYIGQILIYTTMALASSVIIIFPKYTHVLHAGRPGWGLLLLHTLQHGSILYMVCYVRGANHGKIMTHRKQTNNM